MNNRIVLILPYFGNLPNSFSFWLQSCVNNPHIDFLIVTDNADLNVSSYTNISKLNMSFKDCNVLIEDKLHIKVTLPKPYKLCDYKPLYGKIFEDYIQDYEFWGFCDCDMIFGDILHFITDEILNKYRFIGDLGHLHIQKANDPNFDKVLNSTFDKNGNDFWSALASTPNCTLDELPYGVPATYYKLFPQYYFSFFTTTKRLYDSVSNEYIRFIDTYNFSEELGDLYSKTMYASVEWSDSLWKRKSYSERKDNVIYKYRNKKLFRCYEDKTIGQLKQEELLYVHFYKRKLHLRTENKNEL